MNEAAKDYWDAFWKNKEKPTSVQAWQFGGDPDYLAQLVVDGVKTATCSGYVFYGFDQEALPTTEDYSIVLNSHDKPVAILNYSPLNTLLGCLKWEIPKNTSVSTSYGLG